MRSRRNSSKSAKKKPPPRYRARGVGERGGNLPANGYASTGTVSPRPGTPPTPEMRKPIGCCAIISASSARRTGLASTSVFFRPHDPRHAQGECSRQYSRDKTSPNLVFLLSSARRFVLYSKSGRGLLAHQCRIKTPAAQRCDLRSPEWLVSWYSPYLTPYMRPVRRRIRRALLGFTPNLNILFQGTTVPNLSIQETSLGPRHQVQQRSPRRRPPEAMLEKLAFWRPGSFAGHSVLFCFFEEAFQ